MKKPEKAQVVDSLHTSIQQSVASFLINFKGLTVKQMQLLRKEVRGTGGTLKVAKARLIKRAAVGVDGANDLNNYLKDQIGIVFASREFPVVAKALYGFSKKNESLQLVAALLEKKVFDRHAVIRIAQLPTKEVLIAQLCGTLNGPVRNLASFFHIMISRMLFVLKQIAEKKEVN
ncbi:MAG TPA: 50S ribosomal protein L10 [Patescibacteria group bacterium]|jgi:large subunit ribosomal protein L10|nr:50S ribosomal protein L10 [Patescibacteria group bacterium]